MSSADSLFKSVIQCILKPVKAFKAYYANTATISDLVFLYHRNLLNVFSEEPLPPDVAEIFETILAKSGPLESNSAAMREDLSLNLLHLDSHLMKQLRELMNVSLELIRVISIVSYKTDECFLSNGQLIYDTPPHYLWCATNHELIRCMKSLKVIADRTLQLQRTVQTEELPILRMAFDYCYTEFTDNHLKDIYSSMYNKMKEFALELYVRILRITAYFSFFVYLDNGDENFSCSLGVLTSDSIIIVKNAEQAVASFTGVFDLGRIKENDALKLAEDTPKLPSYSIESRIRRQAGIILEWNTGFAHTMQTMRDVASQLDLFDPTSEEYQALIADLDKLYLASEESTAQLNDLLFVQRDFLDVLRKKAEGTVETPSYLLSEPLATANLSSEGLVSEYWEEDETEFESDGMASSKTENGEEENKDEVFYGMFPSKSDPDEKTMDYDEDGADVRSRQSSMKGVITQLKNVLVPVEKKMRKRERLAKKTVMGPDITDLYSLYEQSEALDFGSPPNTASDGAGPSSACTDPQVTDVEKSPENSKSPSPIDEATVDKPVVNFPSHFDIMMELRSKLPSGENQTEGGKGISKEEVFEGSSAEGSEEEEK